MKLPVYSQEGKKSRDLEVSDAVFGVTPKAVVVHQVYLALENNSREPWAHTKDRGDVRGGGKKPWKQKGTGRARHGSIRSPLWVGGGVTFGPRNTRNYKEKVNRKMNQTAVRMCLSDKAKSEQFLVLGDMEFTGKTKQLATTLRALPCSGQSVLLIMSGVNDALALASRNLPNVNLQRAEDVNVADLVHHQCVVATEDGVKTLEARLS